MSLVFIVLFKFYKKMAHFGGKTGPVGSKTGQGSYIPPKPSTGMLVNAVGSNSAPKTSTGMSIKVRFVTLFFVVFSLCFYLGIL